MCLDSLLLLLHAPTYGVLVVACLAADVAVAQQGEGSQQQLVVVVCRGVPSSTSSSWPERGQTCFRGSSGREQRLTLGAVLRTATTKAAATSEACLVLPSCRRGFSRSLLLPIMLYVLCTTFLRWLCRYCLAGVFVAFPSGCQAGRNDGPPSRRTPILLFRIIAALHVMFWLSVRL